MSSNILELIDLDRYPIHEMESRKGIRWVEECTREMEISGSCNLDGFIHNEGLAMLQQEVNELLPHAEKLTICRNVYGKPEDDSLPDTHPLRRRITHHPLQLANDQIPPSTLLNQLYRCEEFLKFVSTVQGKERLYCFADEFQGLNIVAIEPGQWHAWHFDHSECTVTLLLQAPDQGGEFRFVPDLRTADDDNYEGVQKFLDGDQTDSKTFGRSSGTLTLFRGEYALHSVTKVEGENSRVTAIFTYDEQPDRVDSDEANIQIYGERVKNILQQRNRGNNAMNTGKILSNSPLV